VQVGSGISPNGLGLSEEGMLGMALMDKILDVNTEKMQVNDHEVLLSCSVMITLRRWW
jgi:hypothetical protein